MSDDARFAIRDRDELKHKLRHANAKMDEYLATIQKLREENQELRESIENMTWDMKERDDLRDD